MKSIFKVIFVCVLSMYLVVSFANESSDEVPSAAICTVNHTPNSGGTLWAIYRLDIEQQSSELVFGVQKNRKIQSVACRAKDAPVLFSMRETQGGDYEIYEYDSTRAVPLKQLTYNDTDDVDVTVSADGKTMAYQQRLDDDRQALSITFSDDYYQYPAKTLASASPFVQPTLSANGRWLVFVQLRTSYFALMRYDILQNKYTEIRKVPRRKRLFHPSISNDGNIIGWSENRKQNRYLVKNMYTGVVTQLVNDANGIEHGAISADGSALVYSISSDSETTIFKTEIASLETTQLVEVDNSLTRYLSSTWQGAFQDPNSEAEVPFDLVASTLKPKATLFPDSGSITLTFNQEVDSDTVSDGIFIKKTSTGETFAIGVDERISWSHPSEYVEVNPTTPEEPNTVTDGSGGSTTTSGGFGRGCGPWSSPDECIEIVDKKVVRLSLSELDFDNGGYSLEVASGLLFSESVASLNDDVVIPFSILKPQNFYAEEVSQRISSDDHEAEWYFRVYNQNTETKLFYTAELSNGSPSQSSFDIGSASTGGPGTTGGKLCTLGVRVSQSSGSYREGEINYQILRVYVVNGTNEAFSGSLNLEFCSSEGQCESFEKDVNIHADPDFDPTSTVPACMALVE